MKRTDPIIFNEVCRRSESPLGFSPDIPALALGKGLRRFLLIIYCQSEFL